MNQFLEFLLFKLAIEKTTVEELILIDNRVMATNFKFEELLDFIKKNSDNRKKINISLTEKTIVLTEGNPFLVLKILCDFPRSIDKLYIDNSFVAINSWLTSKLLEYNAEFKIDLDLSPTYEHYFNQTADLLVIGAEDFIREVKEVLPHKLIKTIVI